MDKNKKLVLKVIVMKLRNLYSLKNLSISKEFAINNNLKIHIFEKGDIVFYNNCFIIHIYSYIIENIPYVDLYCAGDENILNTNIDRLIQKATLGNETKRLYEKIKSDYLTPVSWDGESNLENCLKMEQNYITYLSVINIYMSKMFSCENISNAIQYFDPINNEAKVKFQNLINELKEEDIELA